MAKRLTEADIRRIFREEVERDRAEQEEQEEFRSLDPDVVETWERLQWEPQNRGVLMVRDVVNMYWKVVEERCNG